MYRGLAPTVLALLPNWAPFDSRSSASFRGSLSQGKSLVFAFNRIDSSTRQRPVAIRRQSSSTASFCRRPSKIAATRAALRVVERRAVLREPNQTRALVEPRAYASCRVKSEPPSAFSRATNHS
ncbi:hypothetical protein E6C27_scaffold404G00030 [Cucumis melo var. makuwa]|uniref:Uncharacterized protein n=1 Tax=Cucumis melo var. makuwa TaxID=1194695 RepID=A0A5A7U990_CUCMM|nr:hypothetical protein E6C27_scaffold404G00030 [Cucumis melo var. makuwa]